jgi:hypothetical protein
LIYGLEITDNLVLFFNQFFILLVTGNAHAARIALVVGNSDYEENPLQNPRNDARDMAAALKDLGFSVRLKTNVNRRGFLEAIRSFGDSLGPDDTGLFYYAGHAVQSREANYLIPLQADIRNESDLEYEAIRANRVLDYMGEVANSLNIVILDACRNNPYRSAFRSASRGLARMTGPTGSLIAYSTSPGSVAQDGNGRNSPYTRNLIKAMQEPQMPLELVFRQVRVGVQEDTSGQQIPWESSSVTGDFFFNAAVPKQELPSDALAWQSIADTDNPDEYQKFINQYPDSILVAYAKVRLHDIGAALEASQTREKSEKLAEEQAQREQAELEKLRKESKEEIARKKAEIAQQELALAQLRKQREQAELAHQQLEEAKQQDERRKKEVQQAEAQRANSKESTQPESATGIVPSVQRDPPSNVGDSLVEAQNSSIVASIKTVPIDRNSKPALEISFRPTESKDVGPLSGRWYGVYVYDVGAHESYWGLHVIYQDEESFLANLIVGGSLTPTIPPEGCDVQIKGVKKKKNSYTFSRHGDRVCADLPFTGQLKFKGDISKAAEIQARFKLPVGYGGRTALVKMKRIQ